MKENLVKTKYFTPVCETLTFQVESAILTSSSEPSGNSLGSLDNNNIFGEDFI